uniref:Putative chemosensory protein 4 n=2 Tax=Lygus TaxID=30084 RepID=A0A2D0W2J6_LYGLI|nr:putative chemosensory protein 4 [Lygus hesperus]APB88067.1 putative chemosensory protein 4 [Lygus lineolaris]
MAMKLFLPSVIVLMNAIVLVLGAGKYTDQYDKMDVDVILRNERLYKQYFACIRGMGKCTAYGVHLKETIPDAIRNGCSKCTDKQKEKLEKVLRFLKKEKPEDYKLLDEQYDPEGVYESRRKMTEEGHHIE